MDPGFEELLRVADNCSSQANAENEPTAEQITRWQKIFHQSHSDTIEMIKNWKADYTCNRICDEHWDEVKTDYEAKGYDRDAYEYEINLVYQKSHGLPMMNTESPQQHTTDASNATYLFKLSGPLSTPEKVREIANVPTLLPLFQGRGEEGESTFCRLNFSAKRETETWFAMNHPTVTPTFVRISEARKDFSHTTHYPTLNLDSTLPQHRLPRSDSVPTPAQNQYPFYYFFYGTLADPPILRKVLEVSEETELVLERAKIVGGRLKTWGGKYKALVDGPDGNVVEGWAFEVVSVEHEDALRLYETDKYEVVRCEIFMEGRAVRGCTFRFAGDKGMLM